MFVMICHVSLLFVVCKIRPSSAILVPASVRCINSCSFSICVGIHGIINKFCVVYDNYMTL